ncbi:MAG: hypothetical protein WCS77_05460, partial [Elusimicrobiaceae bacterium]
MNVRNFSRNFFAGILLFAAGLAPAATAKNSADYVHLIGTASVNWTQTVSSGVSVAVMDLLGNGTTGVFLLDANASMKFINSSGTVTWSFSVPFPSGTGWTLEGADGHSGAKFSEFNTVQADYSLVKKFRDIDNDGSPDFIAVFSRMDPGNSLRREIVLRMYQVGASTAVLKWEKTLDDFSPYFSSDSEFTKNMLIADTAGDAAFELHYTTSSIIVNQYSTYTFSGVEVLNSAGNLLAQIPGAMLPYHWYAASHLDKSKTYGEFMAQGSDFVNGEYITTLSFYQWDGGAYTRKYILPLVSAQEGWGAGQLQMNYGNFGDIYPKVGFYDMDGDGKEDFLVTLASAPAYGTRFGKIKYFSDITSFFGAEQSPTFASNLIYNLGEIPVDSKSYNTDVVVGKGRNSSNWQLAYFTQVMVSSGIYAKTVRVVDIDGENTSQYLNYPQFSLWQKTFTDSTMITEDMILNDEEIFSFGTDYDGDGVNELTYMGRILNGANGDEKVSLLSAPPGNDTSLAFFPMHSGMMPVPNGYRTVDMDGDGKRDLLAVWGKDNVNGTVDAAFYLYDIAQGSPKWGTGIMTGLVDEPAPGDFDGDGVFSLIYATAASSYGSVGKMKFPYYNALTQVSAPVQFSCTALSTSSIQWSWSYGGPTISSFTVFDINSKQPVSGELSPSTMYWTETGLSAGTAYARYVSAYSSYFGDGQWANSGVKTCFTSMPAVSVSTAESKALGANSIAWVWFSTGALNLSVINDTGAVKQADVPKHSIAWVETGLLPNTGYSSRIVAANNVGVSTSAALSLYTKAAAPAQLEAAVYYSSFTLSWSSGSLTEGFNPGWTKYQLLLSTISYGYNEQPGTSTTTVLSGTVNFLSADTTYYVRVAAYNENGKASYGYEEIRTAASGVPVGPVSNFYGSAESASSISWGWSPAENATGYRVYSSTGGILAELGGGFNQWTETGLLPGTYYARYVMAYGTVGQSSSSVSGTYTFSGTGSALQDWMSLPLPAGKTVALALDGAGDPALLYTDADSNIYYSSASKISGFENRILLPSGVAVSTPAFGIGSHIYALAVSTANTAVLRIGMAQGTYWMSSELGDVYPGSEVKLAVDNASLYALYRNSGGYLTLGNFAPYGMLMSSSAVGSYGCGAYADLLTDSDGGIFGAYTCGSSLYAFGVSSSGVAGTPMLVASTTNTYGPVQIAFSSSKVPHIGYVEKVYGAAHLRHAVPISSSAWTNELVSSSLAGDYRFALSSSVAGSMKFMFSTESAIYQAVKTQYWNTSSVLGMGASQIRYLTTETGTEILSFISTSTAYPDGRVMFVYRDTATPSYLPVSGYVSNAGAGVSGASVTISGNSVNYIALTDAHGYYYFGAIPSFGTYTLTPYLSGHSFSPSSHTLAMNGKAADGMNFSVSAQGAGSFNVVPSVIHNSGLVFAGQNYNAFAIHITSAVGTSVLDSITVAFSSQTGVSMSDFQSVSLYENDVELAQAYPSYLAARLTPNVTITGDRDFIIKVRTNSSAEGKQILPLLTGISNASFVLYGEQVKAALKVTPDQTGVTSYRFLNQGQSAVVYGSGTWSYAAGLYCGPAGATGTVCGANCPVPSAPRGQLIARIGSGSSYHSVSTGSVITAAGTESGNITLLMNDYDYGNNSGALYGETEIVSRDLVWTGAGYTSNASDSANWNPQVTPAGGDSVYFTSASAKSCVWDLYSSLKKVYATSGFAGTVTVSGNKSFVANEAVLYGGSWLFSGEVSGSQPSLNVYRFTSSANLSFTNPGSLMFGSGGFNITGGTLAFTSDYYGYISSINGALVPVSIANAFVNISSMGFSQFSGIAFNNLTVGRFDNVSIWNYGLESGSMLSLSGFTKNAAFNNWSFNNYKSTAVANVLSSGNAQGVSLVFANAGGTYMGSVHSVNADGALRWFPDGGSSANLNVNIAYSGSQTGMYYFAVLNASGTVQSSGQSSSYPYSFQSLNAPATYYAVAYRDTDGSYAPSGYEPRGRSEVYLEAGSSRTVSVQLYDYAIVNGTIGNSTTQNGTVIGEIFSGSTLVGKETLGSVSQGSSLPWSVNVPSGTYNLHAYIDLNGNQTYDTYEASAWHNNINAAGLTTLSLSSMSLTGGTASSGGSVSASVAYDGADIMGRASQLYPYFALTLSASSGSASVSYFSVQSTVALNGGSYNMSVLRDSNYNGCDSSDQFLGMYYSSSSAEALYINFRPIEISTAQPERFCFGVTPGSLAMHSIIGLHMDASGVGLVSGSLVSFPANMYKSKNVWQDVPAVASVTWSAGGIETGDTVHP